MNNAATATAPDSQGLREYLQEELLRRCRKNSRYSLRSFAQAMKIHPATLSHVLRGTRSITPRMSALLLQNLNLSPGEASAFATALSPNSEVTASSKKNYQQLALDSFHVIADWYHYALLELLRVKGFRGDSRWISQRLGVSVSEINFAKKRLERLGILHIDAQGKWHNVGGNHTNLNPGDFTNVALRSFQRQILEKALVALEEIPLGERDQSSVTFAFDSVRMPHAIQKIKAFRRKLCEELDYGGPYDQVYHLSVSLYPVTRPEAKKPKKETL